MKTRKELENFFKKIQYPYVNDYWDARICYLFLHIAERDGCYLPALGIRVYGMTQFDDYQDWVRDNYPEYKEFNDFVDNPDNYTGLE